MNKADTNSLISDYLYHFRAGGKRLSVAESGPATTSSTTGYTHDDAGRLTQESGAYGTIAYGYDNVGNRLTRTVSGSATPALANGTTVNTYDANDRLTSGAHSYDFDGNELLVNGVQASYDFENHLVQLGTRDYTAYAYDADGNRLSVSTRQWAPGTAPAGAVSGTTTFYLVDPAATYARVVLESIGGYSPTRYEYGDDLLRMVGTGGASSYYLYDGLGSTRQLTDVSGAVTDSYLYDAYGVGLARTGSTANSFLFQGQQYDAASGTYYLRARYYDQSSGRFISQDPFDGNSDDPISLHRYLYANDDPADNSDPSGQETLVGMTITCCSWMIMNQRILAVADFGGSLAVGLLAPDQADTLSLAFGGQNPTLLTFLPATAISRAGLATGSKVGRLIMEESQLRLYNQLLIDTFMEWTENAGVWNGLRRVAPERSEVVLRANMYAAGMVRALMPNAAHHIMPVAAGKSEVPIVRAAIRILQSYDIGPEHPANGVFLRFTQIGYGVAHGAEGEPNIHTAEYMRYVSQKIVDAGADGGKEDIINALQQVGNDLQEGKHIW